MTGLTGTSGNTGPTGAVDNSNVAITGGSILGVLAVLNGQTGTTYTIQASDDCKVLVMSNASPITVTLPNNLSAGFQCAVIQGATGQVGMTAASGGTLVNRATQSKTYAKNAAVNLLVLSNSGTNAAWLLMGDTGA